MISLAPIHSGQTQKIKQQIIRIEIAVYKKSNQIFKIINKSVNLTHQI